MLSLCHGESPKVVSALFATLQSFSSTSDTNTNTDTKQQVIRMRSARKKHEDKCIVSNHYRSKSALFWKSWEL
jgi:hypothetical protein